MWYMALIGFNLEVYIFKVIYQLFDSYLTNIFFSYNAKWNIDWKLWEIT